MRKVVAVREIMTGEVTYHASASLPGDYHTLCGLSLTDDIFEQAKAPYRVKVMCLRCRLVWEEAKRFRVCDFG